MSLQTLWFVLLGVLLAGYAVLDGFDLGVGILHPWARDDRERRLLMNSIGPVWDGNEVWLVTFGGALFAAFPEAYATAFSSFYLPFMLLLFALVFRAVSMEFRSKRESPAWRKAWDISFFLSSLTASFLFGVAAGNLIGGLPISADKEFAGSSLGLLRPYALLAGVLTVSLFALHGALYLNLKTTGDLQLRVEGWARRAFGVFFALFLLFAAATLRGVPRILSTSGRMPGLWAVAALGVLALVNIPLSISRRRPGTAFVSSSVLIATLVALFGATLYPNLVVSTLDPAWNLTVANAASSEKTLAVMAVIAAVGMPFVLGYTAYLYWVFRGKTELDKASY